MSAEEMNNWQEANQRYLMARLASVRDALTAHATQTAADESPTAEGRKRTGARKKASARKKTTKRVADEETQRESQVAFALDVLCAAFNLSSFERDVLLLCAGVELDAGFAQMLAELPGKTSRPTFGLALAALPGAHWSALMPDAPLRRWRLIEVGGGETLTGSPLNIDERVLHYLTGISYLDARLQGIIEEVPRPSDISPSHAHVAERAAEFWARSEDAAARFVIHLGGGTRAEKVAVAAAACAALGVRPCLLRAENIPSSPAEREALARLWEREAALGGCALLIETDEPKDDRALSFIESVRTMLLVSSREPVRTLTRQVLRFDLPRPTTAEREILWRRALGDSAALLDGRLEEVIEQFGLDPRRMLAASAEATVQSSDANDGEDFGQRLWDACRAQARSRLDDLAQRIESRAEWDDIVLPEAQTETLREIAAQVHRRAHVYERWGFAAKSERGLGINALFAGASGTGKTLAAEVLANELRLDLYRIDLSQVVSKYIGETEKNLRRVFDAAEDGGAVLLFDEADALFGKRSEVKDSHDRYANIEISYLLQRMEAYRGLAILTTNMKSVLDTSFLRRLRFIVQFPFPDATQRARIWQRVFPPATPTENLDTSKLARLNVAGGNIRNIALQSAFLAAHAGEPVRMTHLLRAARREYEKLEKPLTDSETRGWL